MRSGKIPLILFIVVGLALEVVLANGHRQRYGESCSKNRKCDFTKWLRCGKNGKCECFQNDNDDKLDLYYDPVSERCLGRSGANCSQKFYPFDDEDANQFHLRGTTTNYWRYGNGSLRCGTNAFCDFDGDNHVCTCRSKYYESEDGSCLKLKGYGDSCTTDKSCDPDGFLKCDEGTGTCQCSKDDHIYDIALNKCVVMAGLSCVTQLNRLDKRVVDDCTTDASCSDTGVCRCRLGTQIHSDRTCQKGHGKECDIEHPCGDSTLACRSKTCQCKWPMHMKYDQVLGQCVSIASGPCTLNNTSEMGIKCTENAECVRRGDFFSECKCKNGFLTTPEGDCVKVFGSDCHVDSDCDPLLACINFHCDCPDLLLVYDHKSRRCKGRVGSRCDTREESCIDNASCIKFDYVSGGHHGKCLCNRGYKETMNRTCSSN